VDCHSPLVCSHCALRVLRQQRRGAILFQKLPTPGGRLPDRPSLPLCPSVVSPLSSRVSLRPPSCRRLPSPCPCLPPSGAPLPGRSAQQHKATANDKETTETTHRGTPQTGTQARMLVSPCACSLVVLCPPCVPSPCVKLLRQALLRQASATRAQGHSGEGGSEARRGELGLTIQQHSVEQYSPSNFLHAHQSTNMVRPLTSQGHASTQQQRGTCAGKATPSCKARTRALAVWLSS
jgi:hypothetical protein